jgi:hypothetical protein
MQITITDVQVVQPPGKKYKQAEVAYQNYRGEAKTWKLMDFSNPAVFSILKTAKQGEQFEITTGKNDKDYTVWTSATKTNGASNPAAPTAASGQAAKSAWVPDADRQRLIVKQSCLAQAVAFSDVTKPDVLAPQDVLDVAELFVAWVYDVPEVETNQE